MIDGIKIRCIGTLPHDWERNHLLKFASSIDTTTGEVLAKNKVAFYRGLSFHLIPSTVSNATHCIVKGSLATYYNGGTNNAFDYDFEMITATISELQNVFNINPETAEIQAFEFGANINPTQSTKQIINGLRAYQKDNFTGLKMDNVFNGKQLQRQEYIFKIYDKGLQTNKPDANLLRIEYAIKSVKILRKYDIVVLADLLNIDKLNALKPTLLKVWTNTVFYDKGMKWRYMNDTETKKMLYYLDATNWQKFTKMQTNRAKKNFQKLHRLYCTSTTQTDVLELLTLKLDKLTAVKCYHLRNFSNGFDSHKTDAEMLPFTHLDKDVKGNMKPIENSIELTNKKKVEKLQKIDVQNCCSCSVDISHKKPNSKYCSKRCNNVAHAQKRKMKRTNIKKVENENLTLLLDNLNKSNLLLLVEYVTVSGTYADRLEQIEIATTPQWIKQVFKITIEAQPVPIVLTSYRSRKLIKSINQLNTSQ
ncbi:hypothetical protein SL053_000068 [Flavobacterium psychrophilum]|nr:hypothetical protein [Flavobacterium psychrophilum]